MAERILERTGRPKLIVECDNVQTLLGVAKVVNECGLNARVLMEYDIVEYGGNNNAKLNMEKEGGDT